MSLRKTFGRELTEVEKATYFTAHPDERELEEQGVYAIFIGYAATVAGISCAIGSKSNIAKMFYGALSIAGWAVTVVGGATIGFVRTDMRNEIIEKEAEAKAEEEAEEQAVDELLNDETKG